MIIIIIIKAAGGSTAKTHIIFASNGTSSWAKPNVIFVCVRIWCARQPNCVLSSVCVCIWFSRVSNISSVRLAATTMAAMTTNIRMRGDESAPHTQLSLLPFSIPLLLIIMLLMSRLSARWLYLFSNFIMLNVTESHWLWHSRLFERTYTHNTQWRMAMNSCKTKWFRFRIRNCELAEGGARRP